MDAERLIAEKYKGLLPVLNEQSRRRWAAAEALALGVAASAPLREQRAFLGQPSGQVSERFSKGKHLRSMRMADRACDVLEEDASHASSMSRQCSLTWRRSWNQPSEATLNHLYVGQAKGSANSQRSCVRKVTKSALKW